MSVFHPTHDAPRSEQSSEIYESDFGDQMCTTFLAQRRGNFDDISVIFDILLLKIIQHITVQFK